ncbi:MAG TPA: hypothetical protein VFG50_02530 [Rhodothermales bacterium]|nr:hypothetical protein [Rhodothermales bacterium]
MKPAISLSLAILLHVFFGWAWTVLAGVLAGMWIPRRGWLVGAAVVALDWLLLVIWNYVVAGHEVSRMLTAVGGIIGNLPGPVVVGVTLLVGALLGMFGGLIGSSITALARQSKTEAAA